jgi:archaellum component FlaC
VIGDKAQTVLELLHLSLQPVVTISRYQVSCEAMSLKRSAKSLNNSVNSTPTKPSKKEPKMQESNKVSLEEIWTVILSMNEKLTKLDKLDAIETRLNNIDGEINNLKHSLTYQHDTTTEIQSSQKKQNEQLKKLEERVSKIEEEKEKMNRRH